MRNFLLGEAEEPCGKSEDREMALQRFLHKQRQLKALDVLAIVIRLAEYHRATVLELEELLLTLLLSYYKSYAIRN
jgi:hypothetical protein